MEHYVIGSIANMGRNFRMKGMRFYLTLSLISVVVIGWLSVKLYVRPRVSPIYSDDIHILNFIEESNFQRQHAGEESNISRRLAVSSDLNESLLLYGKLLQLEHSFNATNVESFRTEIYKELGTNVTKLLYLTKENSPKGRKLRYYVSTKGSFDTSSVYDKLPKNSTFDRLNRCHVIGNSGSLLHSNCGKQIDDADFVYRCNAAPLKPFAADAGNKSNITSFNPSIFEQRYHGISNETHIGKFLKDMKQYHGYLWGACLSFAGFTKVCKKAMDAYNITENTFILGHPDHFKYFNGFWKKRGYKGRLSTGFFYTSDALSRCNEVHLYGFWPFKSIFQKDGPRNINYHYFDNLPFPGTTKKSPHAMNEEFSVLLQLHAFGIIKLHYGKCD
ncbi:alpha-N-acetylneuraminide alpha-2,8-sialyltransferase-like isoform X1 [Apostichopus japonicus]|uniref:alpha-N-acetylneuraminide alpha-2,8-sialyltransferase-like isoform X1 n=1 Tax=Stichopus japonicus TaxID=307972 RepID=UPI003AB42DF4